MTCGYSGADLTNIITESYLKPMNELFEVQKWTEQYTPKFKKIDNTTTTVISTTPNREKISNIKDRPTLRKVNITDFKRSIRNTNATVGAKTMD